MNIHCSSVMLNLIVIIKYKKGRRDDKMKVFPLSFHPLIMSSIIYAFSLLVLWRTFILSLFCLVHNKTHLKGRIHIAEGIFCVYPSKIFKYSKISDVKYMNSLNSYAHCLIKICMNELFTELKFPRRARVS